MVIYEKKTVKRKRKRKVRPAPPARTQNKRVMMLRKSMRKLSSTHNLKQYQIIFKSTIISIRKSPANELYS